MGEQFTDDMWAQTHAKTWADVHLCYMMESGDGSIGDLFVAWLLTLDADEQRRIYTTGYESATRAFEEWAGYVAPKASTPSPFNLDGTPVQRF